MKNLDCRVYFIKPDYFDVKEERIIFDEIQTL